MGVEMELPEIPEARDTFTRRIALLVVSVTLVASVVAYLQTRAGNQEEIAARETQIEAIQGIGAQVSSQSEATSAYAVYVQASEYDRRATLARGRARVLGDTAEGQAARREAERWETIRAAVVPLTPLLSEEQYATDPIFDSPYFSDRNIEPDKVRLQQAALSEKVNAWGNKANSYVAVLTLLAVALFLFGLSLTVGGGVRRLIAAPAVAIFAASILWSAIITVGSIPSTPQEAIDHVALGNRHMFQEEYDAAIEEFTKAIGLRSDYAEAYSRRATAHFFRGASLAGEQFATITDEEGLERSIADDEQAVALGAEDPTTLGNLGYGYFLDGRYSDAEDLTLRAIDTNPVLPHLWGNLAVIKAALGDGPGASEALDRGIALALDRPPFERYELFTSMRTILEVLDFYQPEATGRTLALKERLAAAQTESDLDREISGDSGASVTITDWEVTGGEFETNFDFEAMTAGSLTGYVWLYRPNPDHPWAHDPTFFSFFYENELEGDGSSVAFNSRDCPKPGEYRLDVYDNGVLIGSGSTSVEEGVLGDPVPFRDEVLGIVVCRPQDWDTETREDFATFTSPDGALSFAVGTLPVDRAALADPGAIERAAIQGAAEGNAPRGGTEDLQPFDFGGVGGQIGYYLDTAGGEEAALAVAASLGSDSVLRIAIAVAPDDQLETLNELLLTLQFTGAPEEG
jgi:tetratricopeptide (TPR) repeat protein